MTSLAQSLGTIRKPWQWIAIGGGVLLVWAAIAIPNLNRSHDAADTSAYRATRESDSAINKPLPVYGYQGAHALKVAAGTVSSQNPAALDRKIVRTSSLAIIVQHPDDVAQKIAALADALGGYLASSESGGDTSATLTIRVPGNRFEEARAEIRKLGLKVENERVDAQDVSRQYVDQDASIRNLRAEEAGYLVILKQATTVKDMLAVSEKLSEVRGQIEEQEAEFKALSTQIETVAISISLRTETETQVFGLNWRPLYQLKLALRDGLESIGSYATAMTTIIFYLPAVLLWFGTLFFFALGSWRLAMWIGRRWFGWKAEVAS